MHDEPSGPVCCLIEQQTVRLERLYDVLYDELTAGNDDGVHQLLMALLTHAKNLATQVPGCELTSICDVDEARVKHPDLIFQLGFMRRFDKSYAEAKRKIDNGDIGKVVLVRSYTQDPRSTIESTRDMLPPLNSQILKCGLLAQ